MAADGIGHSLDRICRAAALAGGGLFLTLAGMTVVSIVGRAVADAPVPGDFELIQMGCAIGVTACLPYAHLHRGHAMVDLFTARLPRSVRWALDAFGNLVFAVLATILAWRLALGGLDMAAHGESSMILGLPLWWAFPPMALSCALLAVTCLYRMAADRAETEQ